jgi:hypothetical protein
MPGANLGDLAGRACHTILMALCAGSSIEDRVQSSAWIMPTFKLSLVERERVGPKRSTCPPKTKA